MNVIVLVPAGILGVFLLTLALLEWYGRREIKRANLDSLQHVMLMHRRRR